MKNLMMMMMNGWNLPYLHGYIVGTSQRADYVLVTLTPFSRSQEILDW